MRCFIDVCPFEGWLDTNVGTKHKDQIFMRHPPYDSIDARFLAIMIALLTRYLLGNWISELSLRILPASRALIRHFLHWLPFKSEMEISSFLQNRRFTFRL